MFVFAAPKGCALSRILEQSSDERERQFYRTSQLLRDVKMFVRGEMLSDGSGEMSIGFTNIIGTTACT